MTPDDTVRRPRPRAALALALLGCGACVAWFAVEDHSRLDDPLFFVLVGGVVLARLAITRWDGNLVLSGSLCPSMLAAAFLGPAAGALVEWIGESVTWAIERYRRAMFAVNLLAVGAPLLAAGAAIERLHPSDVAFYVVLAVASFGVLAANYTIATLLWALHDGEPLRPAFEPFVQMLPGMGINVVLVVAAAGIYEGFGLWGVVFVLASIVAFTYMARLVVAARERTKQYASLSWGVLSGLLRTLDLRDPRASRHAAAVAAFSRDIAREVGMDERDCELAHTAGLLHDIGRFGLSDRVMERGRTLTEADWNAIRKHPELGADLLRDLGVYGPVAEIVRAHHERIDGRGYPDGLKGDEIPAIARIVAVAEVYDTLTADDTYRTPVSSFEALTELRRVAGTQLDARYVEALATLLAGRGVDYRHADAADFDAELDLERKIGDAAGGTGVP